MCEYLYMFIIVSLIILVVTEKSKKYLSNQSSYTISLIKFTHVSRAMSPYFLVSAKKSAVALIA